MEAAGKISGSFLNLCDDTNMVLVVLMRIEAVLWQKIYRQLVSINSVILERMTLPLENSSAHPDARSKQ